MKSSICKQIKSCQNALKMQEVFERWDNSSFTISIASRIAKQIERHMEVTLSSCESQLHACAVHSEPLLKLSVPPLAWGHHSPQEGLLCIWSKSCQLLPAAHSFMSFMLSLHLLHIWVPREFCSVGAGNSSECYAALPKCLLASGKTRLHLFTFLNGRSPLETLSIRFGSLNP